MHPRTKGVEDASDTNFDIVLHFVGVHHGFGYAFAFIVARLDDVSIWKGRKKTDSAFATLYDNAKHGMTYPSTSHGRYIGKTRSLP
jgi:hypothetical protein